MPEVQEGITAKQYVSMIRDLFADASPDSKQRQYYDWLLEKGREYKVEPLTKTNAKVVQGFIAGFEPQMKRCYANAAYFAMMRPKKVRYCEGYGISLIPTEHAWNVIDGQMVDITWRPEKRDEGEIGKQTYFGIIIPTKWVKANVGIEDGMTILQSLYIGGWRGE